MFLIMDLWTKLSTLVDIGSVLYDSLFLSGIGGFSFKTMSLPLYYDEEIIIYTPVVVNIITAKIKDTGEEIEFIQKIKIISIQAHAFRSVYMYV